MKSSRAFTLIELLAVVSITLVLLSLLVPVAGKMRYAARSAACIGNLRQISAALNLYASDNDGLLPALRYRADRNGDNPTKENWQFEINPYLQISGNNFKAIAQKASGRAIFCPEYYRDYRTKKEFQEFICGGYGMNPNLGVGSHNTWDFRTKLVAIPKPVQTILVGDSDNFHLSIGADTWDAPDESTGRYGSGDPIRHKNTANYLFVDGHVSSLTPEQAGSALNP